MPKFTTAGARSEPRYPKGARELVELYRAHGFEFDRINSKGMCYYTHESLPEQCASARWTENVARQAMRRFQRLVGEATSGDRSKRDPAAVKDRQAREREQAAQEFARITAERARIVAERDAYVARFGAHTVAEANAIVAQLERADRELHYWRALMTETPASGHEGTAHAKHRA